MDPRAIAGAIRELLADPERLAAMRARARAVARARYNWDAQAEGLIALYRRILPGPWSEAVG
jgi:glycosyltransferase involved in cell wall biosynthesis